MYLAIDVGTHAVRAGVCNFKGEWFKLVSEPLLLERKVQSDGRVFIEQDAAQMRKALLKVVAEAAAPFKADIVAAGLCTQRSSVLAWQLSNLEALSPIISWQDTRGQQQVQSLALREEWIHQTTGLVLSAHYGASKLHFLQKTIGLNPTRKFTPLVSYLIACLCAGGKALCDETNAARTQLWNINKRCWDAQLAQMFDVSPTNLPEVLPTNAHYGYLTQVGFPGVPLTAVLGDQNAALLATIARDSGDALVNCGTGAFVLAYADIEHAKRETALLTSVAYSEVEHAVYLLEGTVNGAGAALTWFAQSDEFLQFLTNETSNDVTQAEQVLFQLLPQWLESVEPKGVFLNSVGGLGSPYWCSNVSPVFSAGEWTVPTRAVAVVESIAFLLHVNLKRMFAAGVVINQVVISGGLSRLDGLCQALADVTGIPCRRAADFEATLKGTAVMAAQGLIQLNVISNQQFTPKLTPKRQARLQKFLQLMDSVNQYA